MMLAAALLDLAQPGECASKPGEIVVCAPRGAPNRYRLPPLPHTYDRKPLRAETDAIPGVHARAHVESEGMPDGRVARRLLVTFSLPF